MVRSVTNSEKLYDTIIIGAGAAGLTAAIYAARKRLSTLVISADIGGQTNLTNKIENYPGVDPVHGHELMKKFKEQAIGFGSKIIMGKVKKITKKENFIVDLHNNEIYHSKTVILAFGKVPRKLGIPGEERLLGKGVSNCVACDAKSFKNKTAAIIGGGNSAVEGLIELSKLCKKVYLIHRRKEFRADEVLLEKIKKLKNAELILEHVPVEITGKNQVEELVIKDVNSQEKHKIKVDGVFLEIGLLVDTSIIEGICEINNKKEIVINEKCETSCAGLYACGDVTHLPYKQTVIAAGEGAKAGLEVHRFLTGGKGVSIDWTH